MLLERGILCFLCTSHGDFRTRNTHVVCANNEVLLKRGTLFLIVHLCGAFRKRNTTFFCALRALLSSTTKITVVVCVLYAVILE